MGVLQRDETASGLAEREEAATRRRGAGGRLRLHAGRLVTAVVILGAWELTSRSLVSPFWIGRPSAVVTVLWDWLHSGMLWQQLAPTLGEMAIGFVLGSVAGALVGFTLGYFRYLDALLSPFITAIYTLPKIALAPLVLLWLGIGYEAKVALAALLVFFLVFFNTYAGVRQVDPDLADAARLMGASRRQLLRHVLCPHAAAWVFTGLRLALPYALVGAVVGEMLASNHGIGFLLANASNQLDTVGAFAALAVLVTIGLLLNLLVELVEARVQRWQPHRLDEREGW